MLRMSSSISQLVKQLNDHAKKVEKATANAVNKVALDVRETLIEEMPKYLDRPTNFTKKGWFVRKGNKKAIVELKPIQAEYLGWAIFGGVARKPSRKQFIVPTRNARLNQYGNIPGKWKQKGLLKRKTDFIGTHNGVTGVWRRTGGKRNKGLKLIHVFKKEIHYKARYPVFQIAESTIKKRYQAKLMKELEKAFR